MKNLLVLVGITLGLSASLSAQTANDSSRPVTKPQGVAKAREDAAIARAVKNHRCVYYITNVTSTGSNIPQVVTRYEGQNYSFNSFARPRTYGSNGIDLSGSLNVGAALSALDPSISIH